MATRARIRLSLCGMALLMKKKIYRVHIGGEATTSPEGSDAWLVQAPTLTVACGKAEVKLKKHGHPMFNNAQIVSAEIVGDLEIS